MIILAPEKIKAVEKRANDAGLSYMRMMEKAGRGCAEYILKNHRSAQKAVILCGKGKNGGDGFVIARHLTAACKFVTVIKLFDAPSDLLSESRRELLSSDTEMHVFPADRARAADAISKADIIVDAVFGIGFSGQLPADVKEVNRLCMRSDAVKTAIDLPSGLSANGISEDCFKADETLSMLCLKKEQVYKPFSSFCGKVTVIPIGIDISFTKGVFTLTPPELRERLPVRPFDSNKGTFGKAAIIAGSKNMPGAAIIAAKGAVSSGAGLVCVMYPDVCREIICSAVPECIHEPLLTDGNGMIDALEAETVANKTEKYGAVAFGCGLGTGNSGAVLLETLLRTYRGTLIIDADGINILAKHIDLLKNASCTVLLTPHPGEMSRLTGKTISEINADREHTAAEFAQKHNVYVLLKGANTVAASPSGEVFINTSGSTALSRGGSGDLLTGIATALTAEGAAPFDALMLAAFLHGRAGEIAGKRFTPYAATVQHITDCLPEAFLQLFEGQ